MTSGWVNPLIKELHFSLNMLNYALNRKTEQPQEPLQRVLFCGHCHPRRGWGVLHRCQRWVFFRVMFYHPKWTFAGQGKQWIALRHWPCVEPCSTMGQDPAFMECVRAQIQSPEWHGHVDIVTGRKGFPNTCQKWDLGHNWGSKMDLCRRMSKVGASSTPWTKAPGPLQ